VLRKRAWQGPGLCSLYNDTSEDIHHLFIHCVFTTNIWIHLKQHYSLSSDWKGDTFTDCFVSWISDTSAPHPLADLERPEPVNFWGTTSLPSSGSSPNLIHLPFTTEFCKDHPNQSTWRFDGRRIHISMLWWCCTFKRSLLWGGGHLQITPIEDHKMVPKLRGGFKHQSGTYGLVGFPHPCILLVFKPPSCFRRLKSNNWLD